MRATRHPWTVALLMVAASAFSAKATCVEQIVGPTRLRNPQGLAIDPAGNVYVGNRNLHTVLRVAPDGTITTVLADVPRDQTRRMRQPLGLALDGDGRLYVAAGESSNVYRVDPDGSARVILDGTGNGTGSALVTPWAIAVDGAGNVFVAGRGSDNVFRIGTDGTTTVVLDGTHGFRGGAGLAVDAGGTLYAAGWYSDNVFAVPPGGTPELLLDYRGGGAVDGLRSPLGVAVGDGAVFVTGVQTNNVFRIAADRTVTTVADGASVGAPFAPYGIALDAAGNIYLAGYGTEHLYRLSPSGDLATLLDATGDGAGNRLSGVGDVAVDAAGAVYATGWYSSNVFRIRNACPTVPRDDCASAPTRARLRLLDRRPDAHDALRWDWSGPPSRSGSSFGDPTARDSYALCVYTGSAAAPALDTCVRTGSACADEPCWHRNGSGGFEYRRGAATTGLTRLRLKQRNGIMTIRAEASGEALSIPPLPLALPVRVQLLVRDGSCWESTYELAEVARNTPADFKAIDRP